MENNSKFVCVVCLKKQPSFVKEVDDCNYLKSNCGHVFCMNCFNKNVLSCVNFSCPICKSRINSTINTFFCK